MTVALRRVRSGEQLQSSERFHEMERLKRFVADCLACKSKPDVILTQINRHFRLVWKRITLTTFIKRHIVQDDLDAAMGRFERGEIVGHVEVRGGKSVFVVEPEPETGLSTRPSIPVSGTASPRHRAAQLRALHRTLVVSVANCTDAMMKLEIAEREGGLVDSAIENAEHALRGVLRAIFPVAAAAVIDIKDREARLGVLGALAFDAEVKATDRIKAVEVSSRILGDFQRARQNESDLQLKQLAERIVMQGMEKTGRSREEVVREIALEVPEIVQWLQATIKD